MKKRKFAISALYVSVIFLLVLAMLYSGLQILEAAVLAPATVQESPVHSKTIRRGNIEYFPRQDITTVLVMGIDRYGPVQSSGSYQNQGSADMDLLLIFDEAAQVCNVLYLNRDTMLEMPVLGIGGRQAGTAYGQLALAHTYGSGLEDSCENTRQTISDFLYGISIDYYVAMNMDAISILNDAVGGVTVEVEDDFSKVDPSITKGTVTLLGQQSVNFVRSRWNVGDQLNLSRIQRQKAYIAGFVESFKAKKDSDPGFMVAAYEEVLPYVVTDCSINAISGMIDRYSGYTFSQVITPEGENVLGEKYMEFYVDEEALDTLILRLFYAPKK